LSFFEVYVRFALRALLSALVVVLFLLQAPPTLGAPTLAFELRLAVAATLKRNMARWPPVIYPSPAYGAPYLRDSFWTAQALGSKRFSVQVLATFAAAARPDGDPPTYFLNAYHGAQYHEDESAALLLIWAWRNHVLYGTNLPRPLEQRVLRYLVHHTRQGFLITPVGRYGSWWDAYRLPAPATLAYDQGLYAVAMRCAKLLGLTLPRHAIARAEAAYRALYNPRLGYLTVSTRLQASDASALTGEFLSLWLLKRPILSDHIVLSTLHHLTRCGAGFRVVALPHVDRYHGAGFPPSSSLGVPGDYQNGASWLLFDALSLGAAGLHGLPNARALLQARLAVEFRTRPVLHEYIRTNPRLPYYLAEPPYRDVFSWDIFVLVIDRALREHMRAPAV